MQADAIQKDQTDCDGEAFVMHVSIPAHIVLIKNCFLSGTFLGIHHKSYRHSNKCNDFVSTLKHHILSVERKASETMEQLYC